MVCFEGDQIFAGDFDVFEEKQELTCFELKRNGTENEVCNIKDNSKDGLPNSRHVPVKHKNKVTGMCKISHKFKTKSKELNMFIKSTKQTVYG